jgi:hypothetical protein
MYFESKKICLITLALTSLVLSRLVFFFFDDPEGPNLLIVVVLALILYFLSFVAYSLLPLTNPKKLLLAILIQALLVTGLYFLL